MLACLLLCVFDVMCIGSLNGFADRQPLVAICVCRFVFSYYVHGFIAFADRPPFVAVCVCVFVLCYVDAFLIGFAHRPAFVQIFTYNRNS